MGVRDFESLATGLVAISDSVVMVVVLGREKETEMLNQLNHDHAMTQSHDAEPAFEHCNVAIEDVM